MNEISFSHIMYVQSYFVIQINYILYFTFFLQKLQKKVDQMLLGQSDTTKKLIKTQELFEKLSQDNKKKSDQIEKYQRDVKFMEDRIRNLEIRGKIVV